MKTTVKFKLRASESMPGCGKLVLHVTRHRVTRSMRSPYVLSPDEWDKNNQCVVFPEGISAKRKKELDAIKRNLKKDLQELHETADMLEAHGDYTSMELVGRYRERRQGQMFCAYVMMTGERRQNDGHFGTAHAYRYAAVSFLKFLKGKDIPFNKINAGLMKEYERYLLAEGKSMNTVSCYLRSLRAAYNRAIREKIFVVKKANENPFSGVFTGNAKTQKRAITKESIKKLMEVKVETEEEAVARDTFLFSLYTQGMSFTDEANLKKENISEEFIRYNRKKTGQLITIEMEDCMKEIIERYANSSDYIFPFLKGYNGLNGLKESEDYWKWKQTGAALATLNRILNKLALRAGIEERLTSYVARHSWATIASQEGIPIATISRCLGHESEKTTRIYIAQTDFSDVGRANRQILSNFAV